MSSKTEIQQLLKLIETSAHDALSEYEKFGDLPGLNSQAAHPLDFADDTLNLRKAIRTLEGACGQLCYTLAPPAITMFNKSTNMEIMALWVVLRAAIVDILAESPEGLHVVELAKKTSMDPNNLVRILRSLTARHIFVEADTDVFANNRLSLVLHSSQPSSSFYHLVLSYYDPCAEVFYKTLTDPATAYSNKMDTTAFSRTIDVRDGRMKGKYFDYFYATDERRTSFGRAMVGGGKITGSSDALYHYPWDAVKTVCDVGSGIGALSLPLSKLHPQLDVTLVDMDEVLKEAKERFVNENPAAIENNKVKFVEADFFQCVPVEGADIYYLRSVVHDWPDDKAEVILRNVAAAMGPHSRVLVHEYVLREGGDAGSAFLPPAPKPLLNNYGVGGSRPYNLDIAMLFLLNGAERTLNALLKLGAGAGLRFIKSWDMGDRQVLEFAKDI
ncbi:S-adenosyl-L-methionine-dependent methyltransferase [Mycena latifolia]|nr:S-adenosyl-L-methionine-dependent methyltransferase [Mycena latifolia]